MRTLAAGALLAALLVTGLPAAADDEPQVGDHCGDTVAHVAAGGQTFSAPDPRDRRHDIASVSFATVRDEAGTYLGMDVALAFCHAAALPAYDEYLRVSWDLDGDPACSEFLDLYRQRVLGSTATILTARYVHACPGDIPGHYIYLFEHHLGAFRDVTVAGDTITWSLRPDLLPETQRPSLEPGTVWRSPRAMSQAGSASGVVGSVEFQSPDATVVTAAFRDDAGPGRDVTVGD